MKDKIIARAIELKEKWETRKVRAIVDGRDARFFWQLIQKWAVLPDKSESERLCIEEIKNLCFEPPTKDGGKRKVKDICIKNTNGSIFWKIASACMLIPRKYPLKKILEEIISESELTQEDWQNINTENEIMTLRIKK